MTTNIANIPSHFSTCPWLPLFGQTDNLGPNRAKCQSTNKQNNAFSLRHIVLTLLPLDSILALYSHFKTDKTLFFWSPDDLSPHTCPNTPSPTQKHHADTCSRGEAPHVPVSIKHIVSILCVVRARASTMDSSAGSHRLIYSHLQNFWK